MIRTRNPYETLQVELFLEGGNDTPFIPFESRSGTIIIHCDKAMEVSQVEVRLIREINGKENRGRR